MKKLLYFMDGRLQNYPNLSPYVIVRRKCAKKYIQIDEKSSNDMLIIQPESFQHRILQKLLMWPQTVFQKMSVYLMKMRHQYHLL
jgi:hypothetical protein